VCQSCEKLRQPGLNYFHTRTHLSNLAVVNENRAALLSKASSDRKPLLSGVPYRSGLRNWHREHLLLVSGEECRHQPDRFCLISERTAWDTRKLVLVSRAIASSKTTSPARSASSSTESVPATSSPLRRASWRPACSSMTTLRHASQLRARSPQSRRDQGLAESNCSSDSELPANWAHRMPSVSRARAREDALVLPEQQVE
jgi:hypothetical protein